MLVVFVNCLEDSNSILIRNQNILNCIRIALFPFFTLFGLPSWGYRVQFGLDKGSGRLSRDWCMRALAGHSQVMAMFSFNWMGGRGQGSMRMVRWGCREGVPLLTQPIASAY